MGSPAINLIPQNMCYFSEDQTGASRPIMPGQFCDAGIFEDEY